MDVRCNSPSCKAVIGLPDAAKAVREMILEQHGWERDDEDPEQWLCRRCAW